MEEMLNEIVKGRKTFFIAPDQNLLSKNFLEEYLSKDYECYFIQHDLKQSMETKVETILSIFTDAIIFFNIDFHAENTDWPVFIEKISREYTNVCIGVMYAKRKTVLEKQEIEHQYLYEIGIQGGCIQLEYQKNNNFMLIEKVLFLNQAQGRRKTVRAVCMNNCYFVYEDEHGRKISKEINDVSVTHFSVTISDDDNFDLKVYERLNNITFIIKGMRFVSDAILFMKRPSDNGTLFVFAFVSANEQYGLDDMRKKLMVQKMYEIIQETCTSLLTKKFEDMDKAEKSEKAAISENIEQNN